MKNAAGDINCDEYIEQELGEAGIPFEKYEIFRKSNGEVPSSIIGILDGWEFHRNWYYWVARAKETNLQFKYADELQEIYGEDCRVAGYAGGILPREWYNNPYNTGVHAYHIDTQEALNALARMIRIQTNEIRNSK